MNIFYKRRGNTIGLNWLGWLTARLWAMPFITVKDASQLHVISGDVRAFPTPSLETA